MNLPEIAPDNNGAHGSTVTQQPTVYEWVSPEHLPPVGCPLVLNLGHEYDFDVAHAERISWLREKNGHMDYRLSTGEVISGRYEWSYP